MHKKEKPTTKGNYTLEQQSAVVKIKKKNGKRGCVVGDRNVGGEWSLINGEGKERVVGRK
jgi:hypothetical protein